MTGKILIVLALLLSACDHAPAPAMSEAQVSQPKAAPVAVAVRRPAVFPGELCTILSGPFTGAEGRDCARYVRDPSYTDGRCAEVALGLLVQPVVTIISTDLEVASLHVIVEGGYKCGAEDKARIRFIRM